MLSVENFILGLEKILRNSKIVDKGTYFLIYRVYNCMDGEGNEEKEAGKIDRKELDECVQWFTDKAIFNGSGLYNGGCYEAAVKPQDRNRIMPFRFYERDRYNVSERGYNMSLAKASKYYVFALLCYIGKKEKAELDIDYIYVNRSARMNEVNSMEDLVEGMHILTARIVPSVEHTQHELAKMMQTYLFNIAYVRDEVFILTDFTEGRRRRSYARREGQLFPYKAYNNELTIYYYQGLSSDIPFTQYLAFYHVAEYFFQTIAEQDAFQEIEDYITRPSFSPHRKEDIRAFYNKIKKKMREQKEDGLWDEKMGLLLCLKKYVTDLDTLKSTIMAIEPMAINYYENEKVPFASEGGTINFKDNQDTVYATIRNRVYSVRNAIVHSKEGEKLRYEPFKHDKALMKEIPLMRAIAEEIIVNSAKKLDFIKFE